MRAGRATAPPARSCRRSCSSIIRIGPHRYRGSGGGRLGGASGVRSADEDLLAPDPYTSCDDWCAARRGHRDSPGVPAPRRQAHRRESLSVAPGPRRPPAHSAVLDLVRYPKTNVWHRRFNIEAVVYGHLHLRSTREIDGVRFDEVSLGYPKQWNQQKTLADYLRRIL